MIKCTHSGCKRGTVVIETRGNKRKRSCQEGHSFWTMEIVVETPRQIRERSYAIRDRKILSLAQEGMLDSAILEALLPTMPAMTLKKVKQLVKQLRDKGNEVPDRRPYSKKRLGL